VAGTSIGHDLTGILDENKNNLKLNNFYEAVKDDPSKGVVRYPLSKLALGKHTIRVKAWDIANNSAESFTDFIVASDAKAALDHVLNYPNPFTTNTKFQFEHNLTNQNLKVRVSVYSVNGRLVKTIDEDVLAEGYRITDIRWDGKDDFGDDLARGVYLYKVKVTGKDDNGKKTQVESDFEKLVILK
jgi:FlgD Ig-like domain